MSNYKYDKYLDKNKSKHDIKRYLTNEQMNKIEYITTSHIELQDGDFYSITEAFDKNDNLIGTMSYKDLIFYFDLMLLGANDKIKSFA